MSIPHDPQLVSRRRFLALSGGAVVLAACGSSHGSSVSSRSTISHDHASPTELAPAVMSADLYAQPRPQRFAFALVSKQGYASGGATKLGVALRPQTPTTFVPTTLYEKGLPPERGIYVTDVVFDRAGIWNGVVERDGASLPFAIEIHAKASAPVVGSKAPTVPSPTPTRTLGMNPICTRTPPCPLHTKSLDTLIGKGRPVAVLFATPARCQSQYCGPVLDALLPLVSEYQSRIDFVHCDIYLNNRTDQVEPTVAAWGLPSEPWLFTVNPHGAITERLDGAMGQAEMRAALNNLARTA